jgi:segregation and condensation protein B
MDPTLIQRIIEAALLAAQRPLSLAQLAELFADEPSVTHEMLAQGLEALQAGSAERGVELVEVASGFRFQVRPDVQPWVSRLWIERQVKYTRATLETLALIAYRQPITRGEIEQVRGVAVNTNLIKTLEEREWIRVVGHRDVPGKPALFGTTRSFLDYFGLKSLDQLPPLAELGEMADLDPQLPFEAVPTVAIIDMNAPSESISIELQQDEAESHVATDADANSNLENSSIKSSQSNDATAFDKTEAGGNTQEQTHD